jgi:hypothetical protein
MFVSWIPFVLFYKASPLRHMQVGRAMVISQETIRVYGMALRAMDPLTSFKLTSQISDKAANYHPQSLPSQR